MKTFRMFTEDYMDSYALHRTSTGPGINAYVPTADLNLRAQKKIKGGKKNSMKEKSNLQTSPNNAIGFILDDVRAKALKELQSGKTTMINRIAKLVGQSVEIKPGAGRTSQVIIKK